MIFANNKNKTQLPWVFLLFCVLTFNLVTANSTQLSQ